MEVIRRYLLLITFFSLLAFMAHGQRIRPPHPRDMRREVKITKRYKKEGRPNKITANAPAMFFAIDCAGVSAGLEYERFLDADGLLSVSVPFNGFVGSTFYFGGAGTGDVNSEINGYYMAPALMLHPMGNTHRIDLSGGPGLLIGSISRYDREVGRYSNDPKKNFRRTDNLYAIMGELNMTINTPSAFVFAVHLGIGSVLGAGPTEGAIVNLGIKLGGRF